MVCLAMVILMLQHSTELCKELCENKYNSEEFSYRIGRCGCKITPRSKVSIEVNVTEILGNFSINKTEVAFINVSP